jgi:putative ATPase
MRPATLEEFRGQTHLLDPGRPLGDAIRNGRIESLVLWGPPGCGKTTLALLIAELTDKHFASFSAVTEGVPRVREIIREAEARASGAGRGTILFCDEIHRFNKAQQDAFLPHVENGVITLVGATTENPSFELNNALLSRLRVFMLEPIPSDELAGIVSRAIETLKSESSGTVSVEDDAIRLIADLAEGDARRALNLTESVWNQFTGKAGSEPETLTMQQIAEVIERRPMMLDKSGDEHFNQISALHKSVRGSHVEGALYWLARMLGGGQDPYYILRRLIRMASEDIGLSDPRALSVTLAASEAYRTLGSPEGELAIAEATIYLAAAPKSNRVYQAWGRAQAAADQHPAEPVPMHLRNAPTGLMKQSGFGRGYRYDHDEGGFAAGQTYLPGKLEGADWYQPTGQGYEKILTERLAWWKKHRESPTDE